MYEIDVRIRGTAPMLQHKFGLPELENIQKASKKQTGSVDYSLEWMETMYVTSTGLLYQPANHIEGALKKAGARFKIKGGAGKTYKDAFSGYCYVTPDEIPHIWNNQYVLAPTKDLLTTPQENMLVNVQRVVIQRSAVARARLMLCPGWELAFGIQIHDDQLRIEVVKEALIEAGRAIGIGDYRPRYGRFEVVQFAQIS